MTGIDVEQAKKNAASSAVDLVTDGDVVGLGTGTTTAYAIELLGERVADDLAIVGIPTSLQSASLARQAGIPLTSLREATPDIAIDGADQVAGGTLIKGGGGAHTHEKVVAAAADRFVVIFDQTKTVDTLTHSVPIEVLPTAQVPVERAVNALGGTPTLRRDDRGRSVLWTQDDNVILGCDFGPISNAETLARDLATIPGVVEHGLFIDMADESHCGTEDDVVVTRY